MNDWQTRHIVTNLGQLVAKTRTSPEFLSKLSELLSSVEIEILGNKCKSEGQDAANLYLYDIAKTRVRAYKTLTKVFIETMQSGPAKILIQGFLDHQPCNVFEACGIAVTSENTSLIKSIQTNFYDAILCCQVKYQGHVLPFGEILKDFDNSTKRSIEKSVSDVFLIDLINNKTPVLINQSVPKPLNYYVQRRLTTRFDLNPTLFQKVCNDVFVVKGIELHELSLLTRDQPDVSSSQTEELRTRFIILDYEDDYRKICEISKSPVHLLNYELGIFTWIESCRSINSLQGYVQTVQDELNEEDLLRKCLRFQKPVCISDTPGMGKTVLLSRLAEKIQQSDRTVFVRFVILREFVEKLQNVKLHRIDSKTLVHAIAETASKYKIGWKVTRKLLKSGSKNVVLIFDGFDEVLSTQLEVAKQVLLIASKMTSVLLFVATRPHMQDELEKTLCVLGYNILPFEQKDQVQFLTKYWGEKCNNTQNVRLQEFACKCLSTLRKRINDFEQEITGIPLQCLLLAEVYEQQANNYSLPEARVLTFDWELELSITSIFEMYKKHVNLRLARVHAMETKRWGQAIVRYLDGGNVKFFTQMHMFAALDLILPQFSYDFKRILVGKSKVQSECRELCTVGILEKKETKGLTPRFIHRTFAEYFLGLFVSQWLINYRTFDSSFRTREIFLKLLIDHIFETSELIENPLNFADAGTCKNIASAKFKNPVICYFVDSHFRHSIVSTSRNMPWSTSAKVIYNILAASVIQDFPKIFAHAIEPPLHRQMVKLNKFFLRTLLFLAAKYSGIECFKNIYEFEQASIDSDIFWLPSSNKDFTVFPIHTAVESGNYAIVDYIIKASNTSRIKTAKYLMHCCVSESSNINKNIISKKSQIIALLSSINDKWKDEQLPDGRTPLLQSNIHTTLLMNLIKLRVNVNAIWNQECVLHNLGSTSITPENYHAVTELLFEYGFSEINRKSTREQTPLHIAVQNIDLFEKTIHLLHTNGADFNAEDEVGNTILFYAISAKRAVKTLKLLIDFEANWKHRNFNDENVLHICMREDNYQALEFFLTMPYFDRDLITLSNKDGLSPLVFGLKYGKRFTLAEIKHLETLGLNISQKLASEVLYALFCNKRIMAWEHDAEFVRVADYLIRLGGVIQCNGGRSPWELESIQTNLDNIADIIKFDTKLVAELKRRNIDIAELLSENESNLALRALAELKQHTFENLCLSLISCNQITPFMKLKLFLVSSMQESVKFLTPPRGLTEFMQSKCHNVVILQSLDFKLSIKRIRDTLDSDVLVIKKGKCVSELAASTLIIFEIVLANKEYVNELLSLERKIIILCFQVDDDLQKLPLFFDDFSREDLSKEFRQEIKSGQTTGIDDIFLKLVDKRHLDNFMIIKLNHDYKIRLNQSGVNAKAFENTFDFFSQFKILNVNIRDKNNLYNLTKMFKCFITNFTEEFQRKFKIGMQFSRMILDLWNQVNLESQLGKNYLEHTSQITSEQDNNLLYKYMMISFESISASETGLVFAIIETDINSTLKEIKTVRRSTVSDIVPNIKGSVWSTGTNILMPFSFQRYSSLPYLTATINSYQFEHSIIFELLEESIKHKKDIVLPENRDIFKPSADRWIHACIIGNHRRLLEIVISRCATSNKLDWEKFVVLAVNFAEVPIIEFVTEQYVMQTKRHLKDINITVETFYRTTVSLLHVAALRGSFSVFNYLLKEGFRSKIRKPAFRQIIHYCMADTINKPHQVNDRIKMINLLLEIDNNLSEERDELGCTPILSSYAHVGLVINLVNCGVDAFAASTYSSNLLHCCPDYWSAEDYDIFVNVLYINGYSPLFNVHIPNCYGVTLTALSRAVCSIDILDATIELFVSAKVNFNATTNNGDTVLSLAKKYKRSSRVINGLIRYGAKEPPRVKRR